MEPIGIRDLRAIPLQMSSRGKLAVAWATSKNSPSKARTRVCKTST